MTAISHKLTCTTPGHPGQWFGILLLAVAGLGVPAESLAQTGSVEGDRAALVALYNSTGGDNWRFSGGWNSSPNLRDWAGVGTNGDGRVVDLALTENNLTGALPPELGNLTALVDLILSRNRDLTGPIPPELGRLTNLMDLRLDHSNLTGPIPPELGRLAKLQWLYLQFNYKLAGSIPPELGDLGNLWYLALDGNSLTGPIPPELSGLTTVRQLSLSSNNLSGPIPGTLGNLPNVLSLEFGNNNLTGPIPDELGNLASMTWLHLGNNNLTGPVPPRLGDLTNLTLLNVYENNLTGPLPASLTNLQKVETLRIQDNAGLCAPADDEFQEWLATVVDFTGDTCAEQPEDAVQPKAPDEVQENVDAAVAAAGGLRGRRSRRDDRHEHPVLVWRRRQRRYHFHGAVIPAGTGHGGNDRRTTGPHPTACRGDRESGWGRGGWRPGAGHDYGHRDAGRRHGRGRVHGRGRIGTGTGAGAPAARATAPGAGLAGRRLLPHAAGQAVRLPTTGHLSFQRRVSEPPQQTLSYR